MTPEQADLLNTDLVRRVVVETTWRGTQMVRVSALDADDFIEEDWEVVLRTYKRLLSENLREWETYDPLLKTLTLSSEVK